MKTTRHFSKAKRAAALAAALILILIGAVFLYLGIYSRADDAAVNTPLPEGVAREELKDGSLLFSPESPRAAILFYPGGKVEHSAYTPLASRLAEEGFLVILIKMPFRLAVFDADAAEDYRDLYPEIKDWYLAGHSLGGSMAASHLKQSAEQYRGLILLASYSTADLSDTALSVLSVRAGEDLVLNAEKYAEYRKNLPKSSTTEVMIAGGCHAFFGAYGEQKGDGRPTISRDAQLSATIAAIVELIGADEAE